MYSLYKQVLFKFICNLSTKYNFFYKVKNIDGIH